MWKLWSSPKSSTPPISENTIIRPDTHFNNTPSQPVTTPEETATSGLQGGRGDVVKGKDKEGGRQNTAEVYRNQDTSMNRQQSPWQSSGVLTPSTVPAVPLQGDSIPDKNSENCINSEGVQSNIISVNKASVTIMSSTPTPKNRIRFSINPFSKSIANSAKTNENGSGKAKDKPSAPPGKISRADQEAFACATSIRAFTVPAAASQAKSTPADLQKIKDQLSNPKTATAVVSHLSRLPSPADMTAVPTIENISTFTRSKPTKAVALSMRDEEVDKLFSSKLRASPKVRLAVNEQPAGGLVSMLHATLPSIQEAVKDIKAVSFLGTNGDLGIGSSVDSEPSAILSGSIPSAQTFLTGLEEIGRSLLSFGYATDELPYPNDKDVHPPKDRISLLYYWWGFEICIPHASMEYLAKVDSVVNTLSRVLTAISILSPEVREFLPVAHYAASAIDFEWKTIQSNDKGEGVVCTGTWLMAIAIIPRPWDFPPAPPGSSKADASKPPASTQ